MRCCRGHALAAFLSRAAEHRQFNHVKSTHAAVGFVLYGRRWHAAQETAVPPGECTPKPAGVLAAASVLAAWNW
eukprot:151325-Chlamydomonas_euryale.AAC.19